MGPAYGGLQGDQCQYRHSEAALGTEQVCDLWKKGNCNRKICAFRHSDTSVGVSVYPISQDNPSLFRSVALILNTIRSFSAKGRPFLVTGRTSREDAPRHTVPLNTRKKKENWG